MNTYVPRFKLNFLNCMIRCRMDFEIGFIHDAMLASTTTTTLASSSSATAPTQTLEEAWDLPRCDVPGWEIKWMLLKTIRENNRINVQVMMLSKMSHIYSTPVYVCSVYPPMYSELNLNTFTNIKF